LPFNVVVVVVVVVVGVAVVVFADVAVTVTVAVVFFFSISMLVLFRLIDYSTHAALPVTPAIPPGPVARRAPMHT
jgi:hypothetical protein